MTRGPEATIAPAAHRCPESDCPRPTTRAQAAVGSATRAAIAALALVLGGVASPAQQIVSVVWGFDGRVVLGEFNLLNVTISNPTDRPVDKTLRLTRWIGVLPVGADIVQRCYLGPHSQRTLQLYPFVENPDESWQLSWTEGGAGGASAPGLRTGPGALVFLEAETELNRRILMRKFDPEPLPGSATVMGSLRALVLDRAPELSKRQRLALLAWVRMGGVIHLLRRGGSHPVFDEELAVLNPEAERLVFGAGRVHREAYGRNELQRKLPKHLHAGFPETATGGESLVHDLRRRLRATNRTDHNWGLIFLLTLVYLGLVGPVFYKLSLSRLSWPVGLGSLTAVIGAATWLFMLVGARGFGERDLIQSYVYARSDGDDAYEVTRFVNVFVTGAAERTFTATGPYNLFSSAQDKERVNGEIHNGSQGSYKVEIPRFSQRLIVHKSQVNGPRLDLAFEASPPQLTTPLAFEQLIELQGNTIYVWEKRGASRWRRSPSPEHTIPVSAWSTDLFQQHQVGVDTVLRSMLVQRLRLKLRNPKLLVPVPGHHVFFGLLPTLPASFRLGGPQAGLETGRSILHFDVYEPLK